MPAGWDSVWPAHSYSDQGCNVALLAFYHNVQYLLKGVRKSFMTYFLLKFFIGLGH